MTSARLAAARVLLGVERGRTTLSLELERQRGELEEDRDRALLFELVAGTLRWRNELDALLAAVHHAAADRRRRAGAGDVCGSGRIS